jgi:RNA polymerase sigma-70 factor (ECF subfamily)
VHSYVCLRGVDADSAQDLTQSFFTYILASGWFGEARRERGKLRSFLLTSLRNFLANEWDRSMTRKRGGGEEPVALDDQERCTQDRICPATDLTPDLIFERQCAVALLESALSKIEQEYAARDRLPLFEGLRPFLTGEEDHGAYGVLERRLGMSGGALRVAVHRLRQHFAEVLRAEVAETVCGPAEVDEEIRYLLAAMGHV